MSEHHVHVYKTSWMVELDVEAGTPEEARQKALDFVAGEADFSLALTGKRAKQSDCRFVAVVPKEAEG